jgi:hypothetical protein
MVVTHIYVRAENALLRFAKRTAHSLKSHECQSDNEPHSTMCSSVHKASCCCNFVLELAGLRAKIDFFHVVKQQQFAANLWLPTDGKLDRMLVLTFVD